MKKYFKIIVAGLILLVAAFFYAHIDKMCIIYDKDFDTSTSVDTGIGESLSVEQEFVCSEELLDGISMKCSVVGEVSDIEVEYALQDAETGEVLREGTEAAETIKDSKMHNFRFEQLSDCKGRRYIFALQTKNADAEHGIGFLYEGKQEENTKMVVNDIQTEGTLVMKTISHRFDMETFVILICFAAYIFGFMKILYKMFR